MQSCHRLGRSVRFSFFGQLFGEYLWPSKPQEHQAGMWDTVFTPLRHGASSAFAKRGDD